MGLRLYVAKTYKVEYAYGVAFNYKISEFHDLLNVLKIYYSGEKWDERFDCDKEDWLKAIEKLKNFNLLDESERKEIDEALDCCDCTLPEAIEFFEGYYNAADPEHYYLEFQFM